jgi:hypothetical protein
MAARGTGGEEKGGRRGPGFGAAWREKWGRERGLQAPWGTARAAGITPWSTGAGGTVAA